MISYFTFEITKCISFYLSVFHIFHVFHTRTKYYLILQFLNITQYYQKCTILHNITNITNITQYYGIITNICFIL